MKREDVGHLSVDEQTLQLDTLTNAERDQLDVLQTRLIVSDLELAAAERDVRRAITPEAFVYVQLYAEAFNELMATRKSINSIMAKAR